MNEDIYLNLRFGVDEIKEGYSIVSKMITPEEITDMYGFINYLQMHPAIYERYLKNADRYRRMKLY
jgi:lysine/ornithine N-monooxygenase